MDTPAAAQLGFAHFIAQADGLAHFLLIVLLAMSVITWYLIVSKSLANLRMKKHAEAFLSRFWEAPGLPRSPTTCRTTASTIRSRISPTTG